MGLSRIEPMTSWWKRERFTTTPAFFLFLWCPPNCIYGVHIQFNLPNLLFFLKRLGSGDPGGTNVGPPLLMGMDMIGWFRSWHDDTPVVRQ
ncbi:hypothetical protein HanPI659440_Chr14g0545021 [Helianthus annuus]|nr:hypothetical protein HanPI659440_Chr14g0545021 [Helianthus annuus]